MQPLPLLCAICRTAENHPINWAEGRALHAAEPTVIVSGKKAAPEGAEGWLCFRFSFGIGSSFFCPNQLWILRTLFSALFIPGWIVSFLVGLVPSP